MNSINQPNESIYFKQLDGLRAFAVVLVIMSHWFPKDHWVNTFLPLGSIGVNLFFVLSGFLITSILLKSKEEYNNGRSIFVIAKNFFVRRSLRLFPAFYLTLLLIFLFNYQPDIQGEWYWHIFYITNILVYLKNSWIANLSHFWTLAVEEQFYFLWFWVILFVPKINLKLSIFLFMLIGILSRYIAVRNNLNSFFMQQTPSLFDSFAIGAVLCFYRTQLSNMSLLANRSLLASIAILYFVITKPAFWGINVNNIIAPLFSRTILCFLFMLIISGAIKGYKGFVGSILEFESIVFVGKISYGVYLYHNFVPSLIKWAPQLHIYNYIYISPWSQMLYYFIVLLILSWLSWIYIESPINRLKSHFV